MTTLIPKIGQSGQWRPALVRSRKPGRHNRSTVTEAVHDGGRLGGSGGGGGVMMWRFTQALSQAVSAYAKPTAHQHGLPRLGRPGLLSPSRNSFVSHPDVPCVHLSIASHARAASHHGKSQPPTSFTNLFYAEEFVA